MKNTLKITFVFFITLNVLFVSTNVVAGITDEISTAIKTGNSKELSKYFASNVDLTLPGYEGVYSKAQAELIVKEFFNKNTPKSFSIIHQGASKDGSQYSIGNLVSGNGKYRTYFLLKKSADKFVIQQLRFETEE